MSMLSDERRAFIEVAKPLQKFRALAATSTILTPTNLDEQRVQMLHTAEQGRVELPQFTFREFSDRLSESSAAAADVFRAASDLPDAWRLAIEHDTSRRLASLEAALTHRAISIDAASARAYGRPTTELLHLARAILTQSVASRDESAIDADSAASAFTRALRDGQLEGWSAKVSERMHARVAISPSRRLVKVSTLARFSEHDIERLIAHEIGTHALRTAQASAQPLTLLAIPVGVSEPTEEGLALFNELRAGRLRLADLRVYALRILAADAATNGSYLEVFDTLRPYTDIQSAVDIAVRAKRGIADLATPGAHFKDISYLAGYLEVSAHLRTHPNDYGLLMSVKQPLGRIAELRELEASGQLHRVSTSQGDFMYADQPAANADLPSTSAEAPFGPHISLNLPAEPSRSPEPAGSTWRAVEAQPATSGAELAASILALSDHQPRQVHRITGLKIEGDVCLDLLAAHVPIEFVDCEITGTLSLRNAELDALTLRRCTIGGLDLSQSILQSHLSIEGSRLGMGEGVALAAVSTKVQGDVSLQRTPDAGANTFTGRIDFEMAEVSGRLNLTDAEILGTEKVMLNGVRSKIALLMTRAKLRGGVRLRGVNVTGSIRAIGVSIDGQLNLTEATLSYPGKRALVLQRARVDGSLMGRKISCEGEFNLAGSCFEGAVILAGSHFTNGTEKAALCLTSVECESLQLESISASSDRAALMAESLACAGKAIFKGSLLHGDVNLNNTRFGAFLDLSGCRFTAPGAEISFRGAQVAQDLDLKRAEFTSGAIARFSGATITGELVLQVLTIPPTLFLDSARVHLLKDDPAAPRPEQSLHLDGFRCEQFADSSGSRQSVGRRIRWLEQQAEFHPGPYEHFAGLYRSQGNDQAAKQVMLALQRAHVQQLPSWFRRFWGWVWYALTGYGYRLSGILIIALITLALSIVSGFLAQRYDLVVPSDPGAARALETGELARASECTREYPCFDPVVFGLDIAVPVVEFHQTQYWVPDRSTGDGWAFDKAVQVLTAFGWVSVTVTAGGVLQRMRA